jgi:Mg/Co/Ni transporter MgtE
MSDTISKTLRKSTNETCIQDDQSNIVFELLSDSELHDLITDLNDDGIDEILLAPNVKRQTENKEDLQLCQSNKSVDILPENVVNKTVNLMDKQYPVASFQQLFKCDCQFQL